MWMKTAEEPPGLPPGWGCRAGSPGNSGLFHRLRRALALRRSCFAAVPVISKLFSAANYGVNREGGGQQLAPCICLAFDREDFEKLQLFNHRLERALRISEKLAAPNARKTPSPALQNALSVQVLRQ